MFHHLCALENTTKGKLRLWHVSRVSAERKHRQASFTIDLYQLFSQSCRQFALRHDVFIYFFLLARIRHVFGDGRGEDKKSAFLNTAL